MQHNDNSKRKKNIHDFQSQHFSTKNLTFIFQLQPDRHLPFIFTEKDLYVEYRKFGKSEFDVSVIGFGAGHIGDPGQADNEVDKLLNGAADAEITLFDTARGYGLSEERIGKFLKHRRNDIILSTKIGYSIPGYEDWTYDCITAGVETALKLLQTEYIDIVHLHSCPLWILQKGDVTNALLAAKQAGKIRAAAYSGENDELNFAIHSNVFDSVQTSMNVFDQRSTRWYIPEAHKHQLGVIAKRPVGNCAWQFSERPVGQYAEDYWVRMKTMEFDFGEDWMQTALRFAAFHTGAHSLIIGTSKLGHLLANSKLLNAGPLPINIVEYITSRFSPHEQEWSGLI